MVVDVIVLSVSCGITEHSGPGFMIIEHEGDISFLVCHPAFKLLLNQIKRSLEAFLIAC